jgi:Domain of unknown function (DUF5659)
VSTGQETQAQRTETTSACRKAGAFETSDFYLACFLRCVGYELIDLRPEGRRRIFVFRDQPNRRNDVISFYAEGSSVRPLTYAAAIKDMKALLHNA